MGCNKINIYLQLIEYNPMTLYFTFIESQRMCIATWKILEIKFNNFKKIII